MPREKIYVPVGNHDLQTLLITLTAAKRGLSEIALTAEPDMLARIVMVAEWLKRHEPGIADKVDETIRYIKLISTGKALKEKTTQDKQLEALMASSPEELGKVLEKRAKKVTSSIDRGDENGDIRITHLSPSIIFLEA